MRWATPKEGFGPRWLRGNEDKYLLYGTHGTYSNIHDATKRKVFKNAPITHAKNVLYIQFLNIFGILLFSSKTEYQYIT